LASWVLPLAGYEVMQRWPKILAFNANGVA
jgi:hypothetical protein